MTTLTETKESVEKEYYLVNAYGEMWDKDEFEKNGWRSDCDIS